MRGELDVNRASLFGSDAIRGRISGAYEHSGGLQDEQKREIYAIRPVVEIDLSRRTRVQFSAAYRRVKAREASDFAIYDDRSIPEAFKPYTYFNLPKGSNVGKDAFLEGKLQHEFLVLLREGFEGSYDAVRRYAARWSEARRKDPGGNVAAFIPLLFKPGEAYQFDWSHEGARCHKLNFDLHRAGGLWLWPVLLVRLVERRF